MAIIPNCSKKILYLPGFYDPRRDISFTVRNDPSGQVFHLREVYITYGMLDRSISQAKHVGELMNGGLSIINTFDTFDIVPLDNKNYPKFISKTVYFPRRIPNFLLEYFGEVKVFMPTQFINFVFKINPPLEIILRTDKGPIEISTSGEILDKPNQKFIKWLPDENP
jgi:hypothetical protein